MICIAIDGPAGSGKSTVSKLVANRLGFVSIDTGALYRAVAYYFKIHEIDYNSEEEIKNQLGNINLSVENSIGEFKVFLNGEDINSKIRSQDITYISSRISKFKSVRDFLLSMQRNLAKKNNCVMDGRDIGTVVMPNASVKIFLTASLEVRAMRRFYQMNKSVKYENVLENLKKRDYEDVHRKNSPLLKASDAFVCDNSEYTLEETINKICEIIKESLKNEQITL